MACLGELVTPACRGCRMRELHCFGIFWTYARFLCIIIILICFLRLFIEKLPKHRDYKSAVIPEKKDTVKVGLHSHWCPSKSSRVVHTAFKVKAGVSASEHQILQWEMRPVHQIRMKEQGYFKLFAEMLLLLPI